MGTSAARKAPTTRLWRMAKGAATRYLSPEGGGAVTAGEVAARYLAALGEGDQGVLAAFRLTRKVAQDLGALAAQAAVQGWPMALQRRGWGELAQGSSEVAAQGVGAALVGAEGGLEAAVARVSLARVWLQAANNRGAPAGAAPGQLVQRFLATSLHLRLALDLGEPLEAAGAGYRQIQEGLEALRNCVEESREAPAPGASLHPDDWQGLPGWTWVTRAMEMLVSRLSKLKAEK